MKKQLNLICVLIFFFVGLSLLPSIYLMGNAFVDGFSAGMSQAEKVHEQGVTNISAEVLSPLALNLWPNLWLPLLIKYLIREIRSGILLPR